MRSFLKKLPKASAESSNKYSRLKSLLMVSTSIALLPKLGFAASSNQQFQFESNLTTLQESISGPVLTSIAIIMIVVTSLMLAFGEWGDGFKKLIQIVFWVSIAAGASTLVASLMSTST